MKQADRELMAPILIVEDEEDHARLIKRSLRDSGNIANELIILENGEKAIQYLQNCDSLPLLILLDVKMPMMNGFEVLEVLKGDKILKKIPVVMLTTTSTSEDIERAIDLGANDYIVKPIRFSDFTDKITKLGYYWGTVSNIKEIL